MPGPPRFRTLEAVHKALQDKKISESDIDARVLSTLKLLKQVGKFDDRKDTPDEEAIDRPEHRALIRKAGSEGIVLLKNEGNILPIDVKKTKKIALLGPLAKYAAAHGGGSASLNCHYKVRLLLIYNFCVIGTDSLWRNCRLVHMTHSHRDWVKTSKLHTQKVGHHLL